MKKTFKEYLEDEEYQDALSKIKNLLKKADDDGIYQLAEMLGISHSSDDTPDDLYDTVMTKIKDLTTNSLLKVADDLKKEKLI